MKVAVGIIINRLGEILITQRPPHATHGGMWEFPGGKLQDNEIGPQALIREIKEEVGIAVTEYSFLTEINYQYPSKLVQLLVFIIKNYEGIPRCLEDQTAMKWVKKEALIEHEFPEANRKVIELLNGN